MARAYKRRRPHRRRWRRVWKLALALVLTLAVALGALLLLRGGPTDTPRRYPMTYEREIRAGAAQFSLEPAYVAAVILAESSFDPEAVSDAGARGLMQLMPATAEWIAGKLGETCDAASLFTPEVNIRYGCWYLRFLLDRYNGSMRLASAAYHQGQGKVDEWLQNPAYSSDGKTLEVIASSATNTYVNRVMENYAHYREIY